MGDSAGEGQSQCFLAVSNGFRFQLNDLVDVFVGTAPNIRGTKQYQLGGGLKGSELLVVVKCFWCVPSLDRNVALVLPIPLSLASS